MKLKKKRVQNYLVGALLGSAVALVLAWTFYDLDKISCWLLVVIGPISILYNKRAEEKRKEHALQEFRDGLSYVKNALDAGDSAENAFGAAVLPLKKLYGGDSYITQAFMEICRKVQNGRALERAFQDFAEKSKIQDIKDFGDVFPVLKRSGGDMNVFISREIKNITDKQNLKREINIVIAEKRNEYHIMCLIPVVMILYLKVFSAEMMASLYHQGQGIAFMTVMIFLYAACILGGQWILKKQLKQK